MCKPNRFTVYYLLPDCEPSLDNYDYDGDNYIDWINDHPQVKSKEIKFTISYTYDPEIVVMPSVII